MPTWASSRCSRFLAARLPHEVVPEEGDLTDDHQRIISATWELSGVQPR